MPALHNRAFRLFLAGQFLSVTGLALQLVILNWQVYRLTDSALALGLVNFAALLPGLPASLLAGVLSDRLSRRRVIIATELVLLFQALALAWLTQTASIQLWHIVLLSAVWGIASAVEQPARLAFVADLVGPAALSNAIALNASAYNSAYILGPALAALLIGPLGEAGGYLLNGITYAPLILALWLMPNPAPLEVDPSASLADSLLGGLAYVRRQPVITTLLLTVGVSSFAAMSYLNLAPVLTRQQLGGGAPELGFLLTGAGVGAVVGALVVAGLARRRRGAWLSLGALAAPLALLGLSVSHSYPVSLGLMVSIAAASAIRNLLCNSFVQLLADRRYHGRVMSLYGLLFNGMPRAGALVLGGVAEAIGISWALALGGLAALAWAIGMLIWQPAIWHLE